MGFTAENKQGKAKQNLIRVCQDLETTIPDELLEYMASDSKRSRATVFYALRGSRMSEGEDKVVITLARKGQDQYLTDAVPDMATYFGKQVEVIPR